MSTKLKVGLFIILLFAALFIFTLAEAPAQLFRWGRPIVVVAVFGFIIYAAVVLLRNAKSLDDQPQAPCRDEGCECHKQQHQQTRPTPKPAATPKGK